MIRRKVVETVEQVVAAVNAHTVEIPNDGKPTYELVDLDDKACARLRTMLGSGGHTLRVLYRGKITFLRNKAKDTIPEEYVRAVHGISEVLKP